MIIMTFLRILRIFLLDFSKFAGYFESGYMSDEGNIIIHNARVNNLKNVSVVIPRGKFVVITGISGSGKSSLAFDTLFAEGQRRFAESLSSYARQFLGRMAKPDVDLIEGIPPAIAIEQKVNTRNPRSTVATSTEIYDYLRIVFARIGRTYSPVSGQEVKCRNVNDVMEYILGGALAEGNGVGTGRDSSDIPFKEGTAVYLLADIGWKARTDKVELMLRLKEDGYSRFFTDRVVRIEEVMKKAETGDYPENLYLLVDRLRMPDIRTSGETAMEDLRTRLHSSVQTAFDRGNGTMYVYTEHPGAGQNTAVAADSPDGQSGDRAGAGTDMKQFVSRFEADGMTFRQPDEYMFSFNSPLGACPVCGGLGKIIGISEELVVPDQSRSIYDGAIACWRGEKMSEWKKEFIRYAEKEKFPVHRPYRELTQKEKDILWHGGKYAKGIDDCFKFIEKNSYKIQYRVMASRYRGRTVCPDCHGGRLRKDADYVKIDGKSISDLVRMQVDELSAFFGRIRLTAYEKAVASRMLTEIRNRLQYLKDVGLSYLSLNRASASLSGGESQRIYLANSLGSALVGSLYILDEPSIGLHSRDTEHLIKVVKQLRDLGNTVIVVEHDESMMMAADYIVDVGPYAGRYGGEIVFAGTPKELMEKGTSLTAKYLRGEMSIPVPSSRRAWTRSVRLCGASRNNLQDVTVSIPLNVMTVVTGVSGSGKTSLIRQTLYPALQKALGTYQGGEILKYRKIEGDISLIQAVELVDQNPIGRSSRSNPVTYVKAYDDIRELYASQPLAKKRLYTPGFFSFNVEGGRCEACQGEGTKKVEMQFMADIYIECEECHGKRFKEEVLDVKYNGKDISEVLGMSVDEALEFFPADAGESVLKRLRNKLQVLQDVGLGYLHLGQSSSSLSGGEAQRVKLAYFLSRGNAEERGHTLFIFDEPTTGLHFHDIHKLQLAFDALIERGHSVLVIEHQLDVVKMADWVIDVGPEGGEAGGRIVYEGIPEGLVDVKESYTGKYLKEKLLFKKQGDADVPSSGYPAGSRRRK